METLTSSVCFRQKKGRQERQVVLVWQNSRKQCNHSHEHFREQLQSVLKKARPCKLHTPQRAPSPLLLRRYDVEHVDLGKNWTLKPQHLPGLLVWGGVWRSTGRAELFQPSPWSEAKGLKEAQALSAPSRPPTRCVGPFVTVEYCWYFEYDFYMPQLTNTDTATQRGNMAHRSSHTWLVVSKARLEPVAPFSTLQELSQEFHTHVKDTIWL